MTVFMKRPPGALTGLRASATMLRYPFLALGPRREPIHFQGYAGKRPIYLTVSAIEPGLGLATLADGDLLIYALTQLTHRLNQGEALNAPLSVRPGTILRGLGRPLGGRQHALLTETAARLANTQLSTNLGGSGALLNLLEATVHPGVDDPDGPWSLKLPAFLIDEVANRRILRFDPAGLALRGLERRLYEWARAWAGGNAYSSWSISLERARDCAGSQDVHRRFRHAVRAVVARNRLPGFTLALEGAAQRPSLVITRIAAPAAEPTTTAFTDFPFDTEPAASAPPDAWDPEGFPFTD